MSGPSLWSRFWRWVAPGFRVRPTEVRGAAPEPGVLYVRADRGRPEFGAMQCPCGCGEVLHLRFFGDRPPRWRVRRDLFGRATVQPSIWRTHGCRSHFWLRRGRIDWC